MLSNISDLFTMASLVICMLLSGIIFYYLRTRISMLEQSVMDQAQLLQQVVTSLKSSQYRQLNANGGGGANMNMISSQQTDISDLNSNSNNQKPMNLIQVSDDSDESDDDTDDTDDDDSESETSQCDDAGVDVCTIRDNNVNSFSKIIDLSTITSSNSFKPYSPSQSEIKVIELKSNIHSKHGGDDNGDGDGDDDVTNSSDDDEDDDDEDEYDEDEYSSDDEGATSHDGSDKQMKKDVMNENKEYIENQIQNGDHNHDGASNNGNGNGINGGGNKRMKSIVIEDVTNSVSLDEMKNMPVNSLRSLAKTKLSNIDVPTINKMSKKEILKALHD